MLSIQLDLVLKSCHDLCCHNKSSNTRLSTALDNQNNLLHQTFKFIQKLVVVDFICLKICKMCFLNFKAHTCMYILRVAIQCYFIR